tara:strand:- start:333 stop:626 length:294 start_codon:yes stop_codon:yes gene_type:complete
MDSKLSVIIISFFLLACDDLSCRFNKVPEAPFPNPDRVEEVKNNIINQVTYVYECLDTDKYKKQFVAITYTIERTYNSNSNNRDCWNESIYVNIGIC